MLKADFLQYPHHGAELKTPGSTFGYNGGNIQTLSPLQLLQIINPDIVLLSVGTEQPSNYIHPRPETFDLLATFRAVRQQQSQSFHVACTQLTGRCLNLPLRLRSEALTWQRQSNCGSSYSRTHDNCCSCSGNFSIRVPANGMQYEFAPNVQHQAFIDKVQLEGGRPGCRILAPQITSAN